MAHMLLTVFLFAIGVGPLAALIVSSVIPAAADEVAAVREHGSIGGWQVYSIDQDIVVVAPDGRFVASGRLYTVHGADIGAALTGRPPKPLDPSRVQALAPLLQQAGTRDLLTHARPGGCTDHPVGNCQTAGDGALPAVPETAGSPSAALPPGVSTGAAVLAAADQPAAVVEQLDAAWGYTIGHGGPRVTMVLDPECPYCATAMAAMRPALEAGRIHLHMVPVAVVSSRSSETLRALLTAERPGATLYDFLLARQADPSTRPPAFRAEGVSAGMGQGVARNIAMARSLAIRQVPFFAWTDGTGQARTLSGVPDSGDVFATPGR